ncbi:MAG: S8 family serine peptidase [Clostridia bacterium]|nr:S8 family serine peptidase [Clostridia bacterium]
MTLIKKLKILLAGLFAISVVAGCCLILGSMSVKADNLADYTELHRQEEEILKYYHEATEEESFETNKVNVILRGTHGNPQQIGFEDFSVVEEVCEISSLFYNLKELKPEDGKKFTLEEGKNAIITLELKNADRTKLLEVVERLNMLNSIIVAEPVYTYDVQECWIPSDSDYKYQWNLTGNFGIYAEGAWNITRGNSDIKVGIMENAIDMNHLELAGRVFNGNHTPKDNEYIDHGTFVAGIIGAGHNKRGIAGIAEPKMYLLKVTALANSLKYAEQNNIKVINASFCYTESDKKTYAPFNASHYVALSNYSGLFVTSAGNDGYNSDNKKCYPSCYDLPNIINVGATDSNGEKSSFSNYGKNEVDLFAPGESIYSSLPNNSYGYNSGTSFAAPHVTGVATLMLSVDDTLTGSDLKTIICKTVTKVDKLTNYCVMGGRLNAYNAVSYVNKSTHSETVKFDKQGGAGGADSVVAEIGRPMPQAIAPTRAGYIFDGYYASDGTMYYDNNMNSIQDWILTVETTLYARWSPITYRIMEAYVDYDVWQHIGGDTGTYYYLKYDESKTFNSKTYSGYTFKFWVTCDSNDIPRPHEEFPIYSYDTTVTVKNLTTIDGGHVDVVACYDKNPSCIVGSSLITLADGSQKAVKDLSGNEQLLVWNLYTGTFDTAPILFIDSEETTVNEVINLYFSDGTEVKVIYEHAFWDFNLNKYVFLRSDASQYLGHWFNKQVLDDGVLSWTKVQLEDVTLTNEYSVAYSPVTYGHLCYYVNGMLSMPGATEGFINIFEVDCRTMKIYEEAMRADIENYGLFTYEEFADILPISEDIFNAFSGQYLKISIGKGLTDIETIGNLINHYSEFIN